MKSLSFCIGLLIILSCKRAGSKQIIDDTPPTAIETGTIYYIDMEAKNLYDLFMIESLQGIVNKSEPLIWVLKTPVVEYDGPGAMVDRSFWLNTITDRKKVEIKDPYGMVRDFLTHVKGCIIYDDKLFGNYVSGARTPQPDENTVAKLNATAMLCSKDNAIALTMAQHEKLKDQFAIDLPILGNTTGSDFSNWVACYRYIYNNFSGDFNTKMMANDSHYNLSMFDFLIKNKLFIINIKGSPSALEQNLTDQIFARCSGTIPVFGIWNVTGGQPNEDTFQRYINNQGKYGIANFEAFNLSFTSGLTKYVPEKSETRRDLKYDPTKKYIAFTETDGDNYEFIQQIFPVKFGISGRANYPIGWEIPSTLCELDPIAAKWFYENIGQNTFVNPVTGAGYNKYELPKQYQDEYFSKTESYMKESKFRTIRTIGYNMEEGKPLTSIPSVEGVFCGYGGNDPTRPTISQYPATNEIYNGKALFINYSFLDIDQVIQYNGVAPAFFSIACVYTSPADVISKINALPADWVVVSPAELVDIYKQYKGVN